MPNVDPCSGLPGEGGAAAAEDRCALPERSLADLVSRVEVLEKAVSPPAVPRPERPAATPIVVAASTPPGAGRTVAALPTPVLTKRVELFLARHSIALLLGLVSLVLTGAQALRMLSMSSLVALAAGAGLGLLSCSFLLDSARLPAPHLVVSGMGFGLSLILSSFLYRRFRGLAGPGAKAGGTPA